MSLRKGATFHSPTTPPSEDFDPILSIPSLPKRSPTCPRTLENVVAASEKRIAEFLGNFDRNLSGLDTKATDSQATLRQEDFPVPRGILQANIVDSEMIEADTCEDSTDLRPTHNRHMSDSGLGSSISGTTLSYLDSETKMAQRMFPSTCIHNLHVTDTPQDSPYRLRNHNNTRQRSTQTSTRSVAEVANSQSAITRSISSTSNANLNEHFLGQYAQKQIERCIIIPILREKRLEPFHPLVKGLPQRIGQREITCLRDLEKTLIFLAPVSTVLELGVGVDAHYFFGALKKYSATKSAYLNFCETSIQCIHTAVEHLSDRDQRRPADRPYTNGYFLDLVEQIRQYATMMAVARAREAAGREREEMDYSGYVSIDQGCCPPYLHSYRDEEVTLEGGLSQNGRPAELVRKKKGKAISLRTGDAYEQPASPTTGMKRSLSQETSDDSVLRSMARRKKNAPKEPVQKCCDCDKEFKRPCDLTKHEKTHSRPWKCEDEECKYHTLGWPTEKERDRHMNDKHSKAPALYKCLYPPCAYQSKRESNCKQHMEKTHGWTYVRSKNNSRNNKKPNQTGTPQTPITNTTPQSSTMEMPTPISETLPSPYEPYAHYTGAYSVTESTSPSEDYPNQDGSVIMDDANDVNMDGYADFPTEFDFVEFERSLASSNQDTYVPHVTTHQSPNDSTVMNPEAGPSNYDPSLLNNSSYNAGYDWPNIDNNFTSFNAQMITPAASTELRHLGDFSRHGSLSGPSHQVSNLSPVGQGNLMLYSPPTGHEINDEGFEDFVGDTGKPTSDFSLFGDAHGASTLSSVQDTSMFPPLANNYGGQYVNNSWATRENIPHYAPSQPHIDDFMPVDEYEQ
jgi:hypothetical protein